MKDRRCSIVASLLLTGVLLLTSCGGGTGPATPETAYTPHPTSTPLAVQTATEEATETPVLPSPTAIPLAPTAAPIAPTPTPSPTSTVMPNVEGWAVFAAKEDYSDVEWLHLQSGRTDFVWLEAVRDLLAGFGWEDSHILELRNRVTQEQVSDALGWLATNADTDDLVIFYIAAHGTFLREGLEWGDFFPDDWGTIDSERRVLVVESCHAGEFTSAVAADPGKQLTIAAVSSDEYGWYGVPEEGLPILGGVFTHYLVEAFGDSAADSDGDGAVSIREAAVRAELGQREYMREVVFVVAEYREMYEKLGVDVEDPGFPHVVIQDSIGLPVHLDLADY